MTVASSGGLRRGVMQDYTDKNDHAHPVVVEKRLEAFLPLAMANQVLLPGKQATGGKQGKLVENPQFKVTAGEQQGKQGHELQATGNKLVLFAKEHGSGFDTNFKVVIPVHHGIKG